MNHKQKMTAEVQAFVGRITEGYKDESKQSHIKAEQDVKQALLEAVAIIDGKQTKKRRWFK